MPEHKVNKKWTISLALFICFGFVANQSILFKQPQDWPKPNYNFDSNKLSTQKIELGRALFYDPKLSKDNSISCASCHSPYNAFAHTDHDLSHGINDRIGTRNAPALFNLAWHDKFMWDGAIHHLDIQSLAPISHADEMGSNIHEVLFKLNRSELYREKFKTAWGQDSIKSEFVLKSIAQFLITLVSAESRYDSMKRGDISFSLQEKRGYSLYKNNCNSCHSEPLFTNMSFENNGLPLDSSLNDLGRNKISKSENDVRKFKVPSLRNLKYTYPYMHDGRFKTIQAVLNHYENGIEKSASLSQELRHSIKLNSMEKVDLITFLHTLNDQSFILDADIKYPSHFFEKHTIH